MNRRQWKKECKKAAAKLEQQYPRMFKFSPAAGDETVYAPRNLEHPPGTRNYMRNFATPPKGTPLIWEHLVNEDCDEWDCSTALSRLQHMEFCESIDWEAEACRFAAEHTPGGATTAIPTS